MKPWVGITLIIVGLVLVAIGLISYFSIQSQLKSKVIAGSVIDSEDAEGYEDWVDTPEERRVTFDYYAWNMTNFEDWLEGGKPHFEAVGPYSYKQTVHKFDIEFLEDGEKVKYKAYSDYEYMEEDSFAGADPVNDRIYNLNPAYFGIVEEAGSEQNIAIQGSSTAFGQIKAGLTGIQFQTQVFWSAEPFVLLQTYSAIVNGYATAAGISPAQASVVILGVWANSTSTAPVTAEGVPAYFRASFNQTVSSGISLASAQALFSPTNNHSLASSYQTMWLASLTNPSIIIGILQQPPFSLTPQQASLVFSWRATYFQPQVQTAVIGNFAPLGVQNATDLGYLQWGTGLATNGVSIQAGAGLPGIPEIGLWLPANGMTSAGFNLSVCKTLLDSFSDPVQLGTAVFMYQNTGTFMGLNANQSMQFMAYLDANIMTNFVDPTFRGKLLLIASPFEMVFTRVDPLVAMLSPNSSVVLGQLNDFDKDYVATHSVADIRTTGKADPEKTRVQVTYNGSETLDFYSPPHPVQGQECTFLGPGRLSEDNAEDLLLWNENTKRDLKLKFVKTTTVKDIELLSYELDETYETSTRNVQFNNPATGLFNLKGWFGIDIVLSLPHYYLSDPAMTTAKIDGVTTDPDNDKLTWEIEPITGLALNVRAGLQFSLYIPQAPNKFDRFHRFIQNDTYYPVSFLIRRLSLSDDTAKDFVDTVYGAIFAKNVLIIVFCCVGGLVFIAGVIILAVTVSRMSKKPLQEEMIDLPDVQKEQSKSPAKGAAAAAAVPTKKESSSEEGSEESSSSEEAKPQQKVEEKKKKESSSEEEESSESSSEE